MKKYHVTIHEKMIQGSLHHYATVHNDDKKNKAVISTISYSYRKPFWECSVVFNEKQNTPAMRNLFRNIPGTSVNTAYIHIKAGTEQIGAISQFFDVIQEIDPVPSQAFAEIKKQIGLDVSNVSHPVEEPEPEPVPDQPTQTNTNQKSVMGAIWNYFSKF